MSESGDNQLNDSNYTTWRSHMKKALQMKRLWRIASGDYSFEDLCDDGAATAFDAVKEEESISGESKALSEEAPEASKAPTTPYAASYLALKKGEWEHEQLLTSGMILLAMTPRLYARKQIATADGELVSKPERHFVLMKGLPRDWNISRCIIKVHHPVDFD